MSALARYFHSVGKSVYGYDRTNTELTRELEKIGMSVHYTDDLNNIPSSLTKENTLVVITPAVPKSHSEWNYFIDNGFEIKKRSEEHTSELQSRPHLVCRLLLEKKKRK